MSENVVFDFSNIDTRNFTKKIYVCCYSNKKYENKFKKQPLWKQWLINIQEGITGSYYSHIVIAIPNRNGKLDCYEVCFGGSICKYEKSFDFYPHVIGMDITVKEFNVLYTELERKYSEQVPFNYLAFCWNFIPCTRMCCLCTGEGDYCAQFIGKSLKKAGIISLDGYIKTDGYLSFCCCPCIRPSFKRKIKTVKIPPAHQLTVKMLWDIIIFQNRFRAKRMYQKPQVYVIKDDKRKST